MSAVAAHSYSNQTTSAKTRVLLCGGDNMWGRAVQLSCVNQVPGSDAITDSQPARYYLETCLHTSNPETDISLNDIRVLNTDGRYLFGDYRTLILEPPPLLRILNLETAVNSSYAKAVSNPTINNADIPEKGINYHLHPSNLIQLFEGFSHVAHGESVSSPVIVSYANNHSLDFGRKAFEEETLPLRASIPMVGAGSSFAEASRPIEISYGGVAFQIFAIGTECSGCISNWAATDTRSGIFWLPSLHSRALVDAAFDSIAAVLAQWPKIGIRVISIHWGPNWAFRYGYKSDGQQFRAMFAKRLIDECAVDMIYGHSSHHVRGMEHYKGKLIIYGAGFENQGDENYSKLGALFIVDLDLNGNLECLRLIPTFLDRLSLKRLQPTSLKWSARNHRMEQCGAHAVKQFCDFVNQMSCTDSGGDTAIRLRVLESDVSAPGGPVLIYP